MAERLARRPRHALEHAPARRQLPPALARRDDRVGRGPLAPRRQGRPRPRRRLVAPDDARHARQLQGHADRRQWKQQRDAALGHHPRRPAAAERKRNLGAGRRQVPRRSAGRFDRRGGAVEPSQHHRPARRCQVDHFDRMRMTEPCASRTTWLRKSGATTAAAALLLASMPMGTATAQTASAARFRGEPVTLNFVNAEIEGVARAMSAILRQQFVVDPRVRGTITLYSEEPLTPREAYFNFLAALRGLGFTVVEVNGLYKVVPEADAKLQTGTVDVGTAGRRGDQILTQIFRLSHENANNLVPVLRPLISPNNTINANPGNNTLVITDYADNLQRIGKIIAAMDVPASGDVEVIALRYAVASDIAPMIQRLTDSPTGGGLVPGAGAGGAAT